MGCTRWRDLQSEGSTFVLGDNGLYLLRQGWRKPWSRWWWPMCTWDIAIAWFIATPSNFLGQVPTWVVLIDLLHENESWAKKSHNCCLSTKGMPWCWVVIQFIGISLDHYIIFHSNHVQMWASQVILECGWCSYAYAMHLGPFLYFSILTMIIFDDVSASFGFLRELANPSCTSHWSK